MFIRTEIGLLPVTRACLSSSLLWRLLWHKLSSKELFFCSRNVRCYPTFLLFLLSQDRFECKKTILFGINWSVWLLVDPLKKKKKWPSTATQPKHQRCTGSANEASYSPRVNSSVCVVCVRQSLPLNRPSGSDASVHPPRPASGATFTRGCSSKQPSRWLKHT